MTGGVTRQQRLLLLLHALLHVLIVYRDFLLFLSFEHITRDRTSRAYLSSSFSGTFFPEETSLTSYFF